MSDGCNGNGNCSCGHEGIETFASETLSTAPAESKADLIYALLTVIRDSGDNETLKGLATRRLTSIIRSL